MSNNPKPNIHLFIGDDEFGMACQVEKITADLGDPGLVALSTDRLDGRTMSMDDLATALNSMPFMGAKRLVICDQPTQNIKDVFRDKFISILKNIPDTTMLVLVEPDAPEIQRDRKKGKLPWLEKWARKAGSSVQVNMHMVPKDLTGWIMNRAKELGGNFTGEAASVLAQYVDRNPRLADQEIRKLLVYVNYQRPVTKDDVELVSVDVNEGDIFALVDALGNHELKEAMEMLDRLLEREDSRMIFPMIIRQYRLLIQARYLLDQGIQPAEIAKIMGIIPFVAGKISRQAITFSASDLEFAYRNLLEFDLMMKTSQIPDGLALNVLAVSLGSAEPVNSDPEMVW